MPWVQVATRLPVPLPMRQQDDLGWEPREVPCNHQNPGRPVCGPVHNADAVQQELSRALVMRARLGAGAVDRLPASLPAPHKDRPPVSAATPRPHDNSLSDPIAVEVYHLGLPYFGAEGLRGERPLEGDPDGFLVYELCYRV